MSSVFIVTAVLLALAGFCLVIIFLHNRSKIQRADVLISRFTRMAQENNLLMSDTDKLVNGMLGIDFSANKVFVLQDGLGHMIDIAGLRCCRKQKKWLHIPASKENRKPETHLEKIILLCEFKNMALPLELIFYEYRYNSIFQTREREQRADYWEILINQQINTRRAVQA